MQITHIKSTNLKYILIQILLGFILNLSVFGQDTIVQTNSNEFGFDQTYVLFENGSFHYQSEGHCTGVKSYGQGLYQKRGRKWLFEFKEFKRPVSNVVCTNDSLSDSLDVKVFDALDSSIVEDFMIIISPTFFCLADNYKGQITWENTFSVQNYGHEKFEVNLKNKCAEIAVYLVQKSEFIQGETSHVLRKQGNRMFYRKNGSSKYVFGK